MTEAFDLHPKTVAEARAIQKGLRERVNTVRDLGTIHTVAGVDVGYSPKDNLSRASIVVLAYDRLEIQHEVIAFRDTDFPYVPGLLSFREIPVILDALAKLPQMPDLLMVDGQGIAHPRRLGIGAHLGLVTGLPSIGVAKSRLCGTYREPGPNKGDLSPLMDGDEKIGTVLRSREKCRPLFVSPGNRVDHDTALAFTLHYLTRYRLPEPTRLADKLSKFIKAPPPADVATDRQDGVRGV